MNFKKIFVPLFAFALTISLTSCDKTGGGGDDGSYPTYDETSIVFHYKRVDNNYDPWALWLWSPSKDGSEYQFNGSDSYGAVASYPLSTFGENVENDQLGFIVKSKGDWSAKDVEADRFVKFANFEKDDNLRYHVYLQQGDPNIYANADLVIVDSIDLAQFTSYSDVNVQTTNTINALKMYENDLLIYEASFAATENYSFNLPEGKKASFMNTYRIEATFNVSGDTLSAPVSVSSLYKTTEFGNDYNYDGELGAIYTPGNTTFKVWSPVSTEIKLRIYDNGTPTSVNSTSGSDTYKEYTMTKGEKGVFEYVLNGDQEGKYYTFVVTNSTYSAREVVDPYAYSTGVNGLRGMVVDFSKTNPEGWEDVEPHPYDRKELTVYETHVADITSSDTWGGSASNAKLFKGAYEEGTTYTKGDVTVKTGFDHIKELGVNAVQLIPIFDQYNDETNMTFNWGYNPVNYNTLEGGYSSNPHDGYVRIKEFKELVKAYSEAGINIIMDVVYNHMNGLTGMPFDVLMPGYYFRYNADGTASNGSGCGNETASEMYMFRKFMMDSTKFWAKEYKLGGFRFDLMGLHDLYAMEMVVLNLKTVNRNIVVYGEPWTGGTTTLPSSQQAIQNNATLFEGYGQFNDQGRDALIKGGLSAATDRGWVTNSTTQTATADWQKIRAMIYGRTNTTIIDPDLTTNYVTCHDNYTLYDRVKAAGINDEATVKKMAMLANSVVFTSQATTFMLAGEEFLRTKGGNSNSYDASYEVNELDYELKVDNLDMFHNYQKLIAFKQDTDGLHLDLSDNITDVMQIGEIEPNLAYNGTFKYTVKDSALNREYIVLHANGYREGDFAYDLSGYTLYLSTIDEDKVLTSSTPIERYETIIAYK